MDNGKLIQKLLTTRSIGSNKEAGVAMAAPNLPAKLALLNIGTNVQRRNNYCANNVVLLCKIVVKKWLQENEFRRPLPRILQKHDRCFCQNVRQRSAKIKSVFHGGDIFSRGKCRRAQKKMDHFLCVENLQLCDIIRHIIKQIINQSITTATSKHWTSSTMS